MKIGTIDFGHGLFLAPMAGITDHPFRAACISYGASCVCSELISAKAVTYRDKKTDDLARLYSDERPAAIQLFGSEPEIMAQAAREMQKFDPVFIDINMGCPVTKLVRNGEGSALMRDPELCKKIVYSVAEAVSVPVTAKIRKCCDEDGPDAVAVAKACRDGGASAIFVHGRTRSQMYSGEADYGIIARVKDALDIPVIGNGDVVSPTTYDKIKTATGCDGVMIGRGAYGAPWIFSELTAHIENRPYTPISNQEKREVLLRQLDAVIAEKGVRAICELRHHLLKYCKGFSGSSKMRAEISCVATRQQATEIINKIFPV